jgi:hypothetical protein
MFVGGFLDGLSEAKKNVEIPENVAHKPLGEILTRLASVQEYLIFDEEKVLVGKSSENCSLGGVDPTVFDTMLTPLAEYFNFGPYRFVTFNGASRYRYLLFHSQKYFILAKLKPGGQSQQVIKEIEGSINRYNMV